MSNDSHLVAIQPKPVVGGVTSPESLALNPRPSRVCVSVLQILFCVGVVAETTLSLKELKAYVNVDIDKECDIRKAAISLEVEYLVQTTFEHRLVPTMSSLPFAFLSTYRTLSSVAIFVHGR